MIEAGLQAAGLLEVATRSRMMIPHHIGTIDYFRNSPSPGTPLHTVARRMTSPAGAESVDIDLVAADGSTRLQIRRYETLPLPFASDLAALTTLSDAFRM